MHRLKLGYSYCDGVLTELCCRVYYFPLTSAMMLIILNREVSERDEQQSRNEKRALFEHVEAPE